MKVVDLIDGAAYIRGWPLNRDGPDRLARADGFTDYNAMWKWFRDRYQMESFRALAGALICRTAQAQISEGVIKLGVLNDMSSLYSDIGGKGLRSTFAGGRLIRLADRCGPCGARCCGDWRRSGLINHAATSRSEPHTALMRSRCGGSSVIVTGCFLDDMKSSMNFVESWAGQ